MVFDLDTKGRVGNVAPVSANIHSNQVHNFNATVEAYTTGTAQTFTAEKTHEANVILTNSNVTINTVEGNVQPNDNDRFIVRGGSNLGDITYLSAGSGDRFLHKTITTRTVLGNPLELLQVKTHFTDGLNHDSNVLASHNLLINDNSSNAGLVTNQYTSGNQTVGLILLGSNEQAFANLTLHKTALKVTSIDANTNLVSFGAKNVFDDGTGIISDWANNTVSVTDTVVMTDRNDTLGADYVFTGNVDFSGANVTDANVAHLGGTETFTGNKTFSGDVVASANVDLTGAVVTANTEANTDATSKVASTQYVDNRINQVLGDAPAALDTLGEIANALIDDANVGNVLTAGIANIESNTIFKNGNVAMTGDLDLGSQKIVALADPTAAQHGATKNYVDTTVIAANNALKANVDTNKVDKDFELQGSYVFILGSKLANGTLVTGDDSPLNNPNSANNAVSFFNTDETQNIFIRTRQYDPRYAVLHQGAQGTGELATAQERSGNLTVTGDVLLQRGIDGDANVAPEFNGAGTFTSNSNMRHVRSANAAFAAGQSFSSNVLTSFYKNSFGGLIGSNTTVFATVISGSNILVLTGNTDTADTYLGSETSGTLNAVAAYNSVEVGVERVHSKLW